MKREFFLYLAVSVVALVFDISVLYAAVNLLSMPAYLAAALAYAVGMVVHYLLSVRYAFVFRRLAENRRAEATIYALTGALGILINSAIVHIGGTLAYSLMASKLAAISVSFITIFVIRKITLFSQTTKELKRAT